MSNAILELCNCPLAGIIYWICVINGNCHKREGEREKVSIVASQDPNYSWLFSFHEVANLYLVWWCVKTTTFLTKEIETRVYTTFLVVKVETGLML